MILRDDYDSPWKDILGLYFEEFIRFFFPGIAEETDWKKGYTVADKELRQITREAETGKRLIKFEEEQKMQYITTAERIGIEKGERIGIEKGRHKKAVETAMNLLSMGVLTLVQIAQATGLSEEEIKNLQKSPEQYHA